MSDSRCIGIIGAGIGGISAAIALRLAGYDPIVFEQAPAITEIGAGISLSPNAVKGLHWLGVSKSLGAIADEPTQQITCHYQTGKTLVRFDRTSTTEQYGAPYWQMHRADLQTALLARLYELSPKALRLNHVFQSFKKKDCELELLFANNKNCRVAALIGADGLKSNVRAQYFDKNEANFSGFVAWRGLVPAALLRERNFCAGSAVFAGPGRIFVRYPIRQGALMNYIAFTKASRWEAESWSQTGSTTDMQAALADFHPEVQAILTANPHGQCHKWGLFAREPLSQWCKGALALLGDAAHPMMPWFGQGAACAIEDAVVLGRCVSECLHSKDLPHAFLRYQNTRLNRVTMIHREALAGGERLAGMQPELLSNESVRNEDSLGIFNYDPRYVVLPT